MAVSFLMQPFFLEFAPASRVWVYQSSRLLTEKESEQLRIKAKAFAQNWSAHKVALQSAADFVHGLFLLLVVDETSTHASGCSIDSSVHFVKQAGEEFGVDFFDRMSVAYLQDGTIQTAHYQTVIEQIKTGSLPKDLTVFNNLIQTQGELNGKWQVPVTESWLARLL